MSGESLGAKHPTTRHLRDDERALIEKMVRGTPSENKVIHRIQDCLVEEMNDGGMGSLRFCEENGRTRKFVKSIAEVTFNDSDGVIVSVTVNVDQYGEPFELDMWKVDNSPLVKFPSPDDVKMVIRGSVPPSSR